MQSERKTFVEELVDCRRLIIHRDGDRDHMNPSNMKVEETLMIATLCRLLADFLDPEKIVPR